MKPISVVKDLDLLCFIEESNHIEGIFDKPTLEQIGEFHRFLSLPIITVDDLCQFVSIYQPGSFLRNKKGLNVRVGPYTPPLGGSDIKFRLEKLLSIASIDRSTFGAYNTHILYEKLHPFNDCNGRSGRALWAWQMQEFPLGFLHHFYYQTLQFAN